MTPAQIIFIAGLCLAIVGAVVLMVVRFALAIQIDWQPLGSTRAKYVAPPGFDPELLESALIQARLALARKTDWPGQTIDRVTADVRVLVNPEVRWVDGWGRRIAGMADVETGSVEVGRDLSALCHELGHVCLWRIDGVRDDEHGARWQARGVERAVSSYLDGLSGR